MCSAEILAVRRSEEHTSELQSHVNIVCRLLLEKKKMSGRRLSRLVLSWRRGRALFEQNSSASIAQFVRYSVSPYCRLCHDSFFFNYTAPTNIYTLSLHDALPISQRHSDSTFPAQCVRRKYWRCGDRKSTRLNSSHMSISYAVFCLKKKK